MTGDLGTFLDEEAYPALFEHLDAAFPEFEWKRTGRGWVATNRAHTKSLPGEPRPDRVVCNAPFGFLVHGGGATSWAAYVNGGRRPEGAEFVPVVRRLCELAGVSFPEREPTAEEAEHLRQREGRRSALEAVAAYAQEVLFSPAGEAALAYLTRERGFTETEVRDLGLGFYDAVPNVRKALEAAGVDLQAAKDAALFWEKLEGYVLVPWNDATGQPLTLYGRWAEKDPPEGRPKTLALPGEGTKSSPLYFDRARRARARELVAVEGVFDAGLLQARGDASVVAYAGVELSGAQVETLARYGVRAVTICPDPDPEGEAGAVGSVVALARRGIAAYVTEALPDGLDPDEFVLRDGLEKWEALVHGAGSGVLYVALTRMGNVTPDSPLHERREAVETALGALELATGDRAVLEREDLLSVVPLRLGYSREALEEIAEEREDRRRKAERERGLVEALTKAQALLAEKKGSAPEVARKLRRELASLEARDVEPPPPFSVERLDRESAVTPAGRSSGWEALDRIGVRFHAGDLSLLAARTAHGKSAALVGLLGNWLQAGTREELFVYYSTEEPELRVYHRLLALLTAKAEDGWTVDEVRDFLRDRRSRDSWPSWKALEAAKETLRGWEPRLLVVHRPRWTVEDLAAHAQRLTERGAVGAVLVDYLQRVPPPSGSKVDRRDIEVSAVARRLRALAEEVSAPVVAAAQLNREAVPDKYREKLAGKDYKAAQDVIRTARPELYHLREGGSEQEADFVLGLLNYAADYPETETTGPVPRVTRFDIGTLKARAGTAPGRWASLAFEGRFGLLRDLEDREDLEGGEEELVPWR